MTDESQNVTCPVCGRTVPAGRYCGACGAHLRGDASSAGRMHSFVVNPHEHVFQPSPISVLFPHLPQDESVAFRVALLVVALALVIVGYLHLTGASVILASAAVPLLFLVYLLDVEVFEHRPLLSLAITVGTGAVLGAIYAFFTGAYVSHTALLNAAPQGAPLGRILLVAVVFPLLAQALMLVGPFALRGLRAYDEVLDGFAAGAGSALGFVLTSSLINLFPEVQTPVTTTSSDVVGAVMTLLHGLVVPLLWAGTTGLVAAAIWLKSAPMRRIRRFDWATTYPFVIAVAAATQIIVGLAAVYVHHAPSALLIYCGVGVALLFIVRFALHAMLLVEAVEPTTDEDTVCSHCGHVVPRMAFCSNCGGAVRATPKTGASAAGRTVR